MVVSASGPDRVTEGGNADFTVSLSRAPTTNLTVNYQTYSALAPAGPGDVRRGFHRPVRHAHLRARRDQQAGAGAYPDRRHERSPSSTSGCSYPARPAAGVSLRPSGPAPPPRASWTPPGPSTAPP